MEFKIPSNFFISDISSLMAALCATLLSFFFATVLIFRRARQRRSPFELEDLMPSNCVGELKGIAGGEKMTVLVESEWEMGTSMMEQLVPEITMHALSYLDYLSLCTLSMTNSVMHRAANDDIAWKALYHKDFTLEQGHAKPGNGWKAYYAATRDIVNINTEFFRIVKERSHSAMSQFWLNADYVKCFHATGESCSGYNEVMNGWRLAFSWENVANFHIQDVRTRVLSDMAWVTMKAIAGTAYNVTNVYELHNGRWYMVHHHRSVALILGGADQQFVQG